ncbi:hypothetical protein LEP1GSC072_4225 [Leptospira noguchii str. Bonito]|nr:hypothetical protein LEP1GSC072_4225 [Leptospira noguchii str. Bonito]
MTIARNYNYSRDRSFKLMYYVSFMQLIDQNREPQFSYVELMLN